MLGQTAYELKDIEYNEGIKVNKLRKDIKNRILVPSGKTCGTAYYVIQSELDRYLDVINKRFKLSERQIDEMKHCIGLDYKNKPYRNRFYCQSDDENWNDLVNRGLANKGNEDKEKHCCFWLNERGVAYILGKSLSIEKYEDL